MKKKIIISLLLILSLTLVTGCNESVNNTSQSSSNGSAVSGDNKKDEGLWFIGKSLELKSAASNNGARITFTEPNAKGEPTKITITGGAKLDGESIDGTYTLHPTECTSEQIYGVMTGNAPEKLIGLMISTIKGELYDNNGKLLYVDISLN